MQDVTTDRVEFPSATSEDVLTEVLRAGAQRMLATAVEAEVADWIDRHAHMKDQNGRRQVVRNGHLPERTITTGLGQVAVRQPRVRDRRPAGEREKFTSKILPPYVRKTKSIEDLIPWLYLKGVSTGDFPEALAALLGADAAGLSATTVRLRHRKTKGNGSRKACLTMVFKLVQAAEKKGRVLKGAKLIPDVIRGVTFTDGIREDRAAA